jgi:hypothetical protein
MLSPVNPDFIESGVEENEPLPYGDLDQRSPQQEAEELARQAKRFQVQTSQYSGSNYSTRSSPHDVFQSIGESIGSRLWRVFVKVTALSLPLVIN